MITQKWTGVSIETFRTIAMSSKQIKARRARNPEKITAERELIFNPCFSLPYIKKTTIDNTGYTTSSNRQNVSPKIVSKFPTLPAKWESPKVVKIISIPKANARISFFIHNPTWQFTYNGAGGEI